MAQAWDNLGLTLYRAGRPADARECFEKETALSPTAPYAHYNLGCALAAEGKTDAAMAAFQRTIEVAPSHVEAMHNLAILQGEKKDRNPAAEFELLDRVVRTAPDYAAGHLSLARLYHTDAKRRDLEKALDHYTQYVKLERDDPQTVAQVVKTMTSIRQQMTAATLSSRVGK